MSVFIIVLRLFRLLRFSLFFFFLLLLVTPNCTIAKDKNGGDIGDIASGSNTPPPLPPPPPPLRRNFSPFRPSIAVIVGILTTLFSITFLLLLYAKHCKRGNGYPNGSTNSRGFVPSTSRKNSGIDRTVIESLPVFRFGSLRGQKDGLECAVCLNRFESVEVLRLLPKCKHAFHVECVDTWLDAHSTCPLCRYRVEPEDILLVENHKMDDRQLSPPPPPPAPPPQEDEERDLRRVSGRHSSAGERGSGTLQIIVERQGVSGISKTTSFTGRRSFDSSDKKKKNMVENVSIGCFEKPRKDGLLLNEGTTSDRTSFDRRFEHRIVVSGGSAGSCGAHHRWSDVQPSDLLYLRSEMIIGDSRRFSRAWGSTSIASGIDEGRKDGRRQKEKEQSGRSVINVRSVSEITGLSRVSNEDHNHRQRWRQRQRQERVVARWLAWISQSKPAVQSGQASDVV
ncbi:unnamed protein product [Ilex paraguariensis]|uniref:RING-type E3 ubiquitin transferase n=1 Tax=Ilex paraguariensis TaxID=185542 RepID=A0ABC8QLT8_9AQUA